ncbi:MAG: 3D-(3,5/4)-trihydroxycyclohexane-1,2-dione acylhydrolase (decyclizing) [Spirochaetales bacterium]|jgi:3D-(3,5/4)-trihydroxycyclohexane-1,2-dione acylhydrolase (decyclizing)|nr:3D-(3,5/4)-trihydroxycyclohexane-1,2-dione acylhydrolase (decyclizing) [Spirochaetales bacterium]
MKTIRLTVAQALIKFMNNQWIEFDGVQQRMFKGMFTIFGHGNVVGLGQALEEDPGELIVHQGKNEQGMGLAAMGYAKQKLRKQIYACTSSIGPGAANMVTAAANATANRIPVLFLPGDQFATRQPDPVLQQVERFNDFTITVNDAFKAVSMYWDRVSRPEQLMTAMINACRVLADPADTGAVTIALPQDVEGEAYDYPESFFHKRVHRIERRPPTEEMVLEAAAAIKKSKKPMLICGGGVKYSEAAESFKRFAEKLNIPFGETQAGKSAIPWDHYLNLGGVGTTGNLAANTIAQEADLVIGVGTRYSDFTTASKWVYQNNDVQFLNINIGSFDSYKMDGIRVTADAKAALDEILELTDTSGGYTSGWKDEIAQAREAWAKELDRLYSIDYTGVSFKPEIAGQRDSVLAEFVERFGSGFSQTKVIGILDEHLDENAIVVGAAGSLPGDLQRMWRAKKENTYHMEYGFSNMGYEINASLGVKLACPDQEVYALVGDGSYMMLHSELPTSIQEGKKINIILFDNASFGCINNLQMEHGQGSFGTETRHRNPETGKLEGPLLKVDFAMNAASYGCKTYTVKTEQELIEALEDSKKQTVSTLIDIKVLPKTMTDGYKGFWRVGSAEVARNPEIVRLHNEMDKELEKARRY